MCQGVAKNPESEEKVQNPSSKFEKLAPIFNFKSKEKKTPEIVTKKRKKVKIKNEKMQTLPKIYNYFSVKQVFEGNKPNQTQLKPTETPLIATTKAQLIDRDGINQKQTSIEDKPKQNLPPKRTPDDLLSKFDC